jgi:ATP phosphoribosyltransferase regulatory subunit
MNGDSSKDRWLLPEGVDEALPETAARLETARRSLLDLYAAWGFELVMPPFIEYLDSLLTGTGSDLEIETFKLTDQMTGRMMGVRADMTPQVARIDAHRLPDSGPRRLCYIGTVLHTRSDGMGGSRSPLQVGAEIFGHQGLDSDAEVILLMLESLKQLGLGPVYLDLGHVAIYRELAGAAGLDGTLESELFALLQKKALPEIAAFLDAGAIAEPWRALLLELSGLHGDAAVLTRARARFASLPGIIEHIDYLQVLAEAVGAEAPEVIVRYDLAELRGYHYKTGVAFAAYVAGEGREVGRGGRYDDIGKVFGRARPATGFSLDLKRLVVLSALPAALARDAIFVASPYRRAAAAHIRALRQAGERVLIGLEGADAAAQRARCGRELVPQGKDFDVRAIAPVSGSG